MLALAIANFNQLANTTPDWVGLLAQPTCTSQHAMLALVLQAKSQQAKPTDQANMSGWLVTCWLQGSENFENFSQQGPEIPYQKKIRVFPKQI